jgi:hypothetical protein
MGTAMYEALRGRKAGRHWNNLVDYSLEELMERLESQFLEGMTWHNYGKDGWHVDHIVPLVAFRYETPDDPEFKECWALSNLRPLWAHENWAKNDKVSVNGKLVRFSLLRKNQTKEVKHGSC